MGRIRNRNTKPEVLVRRTLHRMGYRFTINGPLNKKLPGRPDIVLPKHRTAIFVHGCFWHRHEGCRDTTTPKTRTDWWLQKLSGNVARDQKNRSALRESGWNVVVVWECEAAKPLQLQEMLNREVRRLVRYPAAETIAPIPLAAEHPGSYPARKTRQRKKG
jgi:DNA mismatch endonuclease, patch repair protein